MQLSYTALATDPNLKAYYKMETGALTTDSSGNSKTLTNNNTVAENASGKYGYAADFGSSNSNKYLSVADNMGVTGGAFSMVGWFKIPSDPTAQQYGLLFQSSATNNVAFWIDYEYNGGTKRLVFRRYKAGVSTDGPVYTVTLGDNAWHHVALTYDGSTIRGYLDNVQVGGDVSASGNGIGTGTDLVAIGSDQINGNVSGNRGLADDCAFFNRKLTVAEISILNEVGSPSPSLSSSLSPSSSISRSPSSSQSPSSSISLSPSISVSLSPSSSASPSSSFSPSPSTSVSRSPSSSLSPSSSPSPSPVANTLSVDLVCISFVTVYADKYAVENTNYVDKYAVHSTSYIDRYSVRNTIYVDKYTDKNGDCC